MADLLADIGRLRDTLAEHDIEDGASGDAEDTDGRAGGGGDKAAGGRNGGPAATRPSAKLQPTAAGGLEEAASPPRPELGASLDKEQDTEVEPVRAEPGTQPGGSAAPDAGATPGAVASPTPTPTPTKPSH